MLPLTFPKTLKITKSICIAGYFYNQYSEKKVIWMRLLDLTVWVQYNDAQTHENYIKTENISILPWLSQPLLNEILE